MIIEDMMDQVESDEMACVTEPKPIGSKNKLSAKSAPHHAVVTTTRRTGYVPDHSTLEFQDIVDSFSSRSVVHSVFAETLVSEQNVLTKENTRLNKAALLRALNKRCGKITGRRMEELLDEFRRCFLMF
jgi:hypothetical protein